MMTKEKLDGLIERSDARLATMEAEDDKSAKRREDIETLRAQITEWKAQRLALA